MTDEKDRPEAAPPAPGEGPGDEPSSPALEKLRAARGDDVLEVSGFAGEVTVRVRRESLLEVLRLLRDDPDCDFRYLANLSATHFPERDEPLEVVYHLYSIGRNQRLNLKVSTSEEEPVPSATPLYRVANWHEREAFDLVGVRFSGHPDLKRILLTETWEGHPLRKEYPLEGKPGDHRSYREET